MIHQPRYVEWVLIWGQPTHYALAASAANKPSIHLFKLPQLIAPGEIGASPLLPSFLYLPAPGELAPKALRLP